MADLFVMGMGRPVYGNVDGGVHAVTWVDTGGGTFTSTQQSNTGGGQESLPADEEDEMK